MEFSSLIEGLAQLLEEGMSLPDFYDELLIRTGYVDMLEAKNTEENRTRLENVRELKSSIQTSPRRQRSASRPARKPPVRSPPDLIQ